MAREEPKEQASTNGQAPVPDSADDKMAQVRELMFGGAVRDLERRHRDTAARLDEAIQRIAADMERRVTALEGRVMAKLDGLATQLHDEGQARIAALDDAENRLSLALRTQRDDALSRQQRLEAELAATEARLRDVGAQLAAEMQAGQDSIRQALSGARRELGDEKLAREDFADLLAELSLRLRIGETAVRDD
ncbi:hypothetical protein [Luteimonas abyssi]|uniref:hypothetical protein n=1 Tax=Luteimonas abyssi TaxID=1247514 RepID=UPI000A6F3899|nr:hypothetical protein [Luteimonas abyssi]